MRVVEKNTWSAKAVRQLTSLRPVADTRKGECRRCGNCCKLPRTCPFLRYNSDGESYCRIYKLRPLSCKKYPRTRHELLTKDTCGFAFD